MSRGQTTSGDATGGGNRPKSGEFHAIASPPANAGAAMRVSTPPTPADTGSDIDSDWDAPDSNRAKSPGPAKVAPRPVISIGPPPTEAKSTVEPAPSVAAAAAPAAAQFIEPRVNNEHSAAAAAPAAAQFTEPRVNNEHSASPAAKDKRRQIGAVAASKKSRASVPPVESKAAGVALLNSRSKPPEAPPMPASVPPAGSLAAPPSVHPESLKKLLTDGPESDFSTLDIAKLVTDVMGSQRPPPVTAVPQASAPVRSERDKTQSVPSASSGAAAKEVAPSSVAAASTAPKKDVAPSASKLKPAQTANSGAPQEEKPAPAAAQSVALLAQSPLQGPSVQRPDNVMEPDGWDVPAEPSASNVGATSSTTAAEPVRTEVDPKAVATASESAVKVLPQKSPATKSTEAEAEKAPPSSRRKHKKRQQITAKKAQPAQKAKTKEEHVETEWSGEFFAVSPESVAHADEYHDHVEIDELDERRRRSLSPEVRERRARYRVWVLWLVVGMLVLLAAAIAIKMLRHH